MNRFFKAIGIFTVGVILSGAISEGARVYYSGDAPTTKGDIFVYNGTKFVRVAVGTDGQALVAASGEASGTKFDTVGGGGSSTLADTGAASTDNTKATITLAGTADHVTITDGANPISITPGVESLISADSINILDTALDAAITITAGGVSVPLGSFSVANGISIGGGVTVVPGGAGTETIGTAGLVAGTATVTTTSAQIGQFILVTRNTPGGTLGELSAPQASVVNGVSFVINSSSNTDTSTVNWWIIRN